MATTPHPITIALRIMDAWLGLPERDYKATVYLFSYKLPPEEVLEAVVIAQDKKPDGGIQAFKYFCGVCHRKIEKRIIELSWN